MSFFVHKIINDDIFSNLVINSLKGGEIIFLISWHKVRNCNYNSVTGIDFYNQTRYLRTSG